jgi:hypothetical protein
MTAQAAMIKDLRNRINDLYGALVMTTLKLRALEQRANGNRGRRSDSVECPHCHWGFAPSVVDQHIREKH